jgi:hypothetical protein
VGLGTAVRALPPAGGGRPGGFHRVFRKVMRLVISNIRYQRVIERTYKGPLYPVFILDRGWVGS